MEIEESTIMEATGSDDCSWTLLTAVHLAATGTCGGTSLDVDAAWLQGKEAASTDSDQKYHSSQQNALARGQISK